MENAPKTRQNTGQTVARNRCYTLAVVCVFMLCFVLLIVNTVLWIKYSILTKEKEELQTRHDTLILERDQLRSGYAPLLISYREITLEKDCLKERMENLTIKKEELQNTTDRLKSRLDAIRTQEEDKWKRFNSSQYYISEMKSWYDSKLDCEKRGGHLVIINNWEEENFINTALGKSRAWIGLSAPETVNVWKWVDNQSLTTRFWRNDEPNGKGNENCVEIFEPENEHSWNDRDCNNKAPWICEKNRN